MKSYFHKITKSSSIYETFLPLSFLLKFCGFYYDGSNSFHVRDTNVGHKSNKAALECFKFILSAAYSILFVFLSVMNMILGELEPKTTTSFLLRHGWHKLYILKLLYLSIIVWNNFYFRWELRQCLRLIEKYDRLCEVRLIS